MSIKIKAAIFLAFCSLSAFGKKPEPLSHNYQNPAQGNVIRFSPLSIFYGGFGVGLSYERFIDKGQRVSINLPLYGGIRNYFIGESKVVGIVDRNFSILINPGLKLYPRGHGRKLVYSIGPSVFLSYGTENGYKSPQIPVSNGDFVEYSKGTEMRIGSMINNNFTFNISRKINVGLEAGIGVNLYSKLKNTTFQTSKTGLIEPMGLFAFHIGYKF